MLTGIHIQDTCIGFNTRNIAKQAVAYWKIWKVIDMAIDVLSIPT